MTKLSTWIKKKGTPFRRTVKNGEGWIHVMFYDGYVTIQSVQFGTLKGANREIHISRSAWIKLLRELADPTRLMEGPDFDRYQAERRYHDEEMQHLQELRAQKRSRKRPRT